MIETQSELRFGFRSTINGSVSFFYYDGWTLIEEQNASNAVLARYVHGARIDELIANATPTSTTYYHHDALGSTTALTDSLGNLVEHYTYDVFGAPTILNSSHASIPTSAVGNRFLFTGREYIQQAALYDYRNRIYSPSFGRFLQTDPLRFAPGDSNLYRYVRNSPTLFADPMGLCKVGEKQTIQIVRLEVEPSFEGFFKQSQGSSETSHHLFGNGSAGLSLEGASAALPSRRTISFYISGLSARAEDGLPIPSTLNVYCRGLEGYWSRPHGNDNAEKSDGSLETG